MPYGIHDQLSSTRTIFKVGTRWSFSQGSICFYLRDQQVLLSGTSWLFPQRPTGLSLAAGPSGTRRLFSQGPAGALDRDREDQLVFQPDISWSSSQGSIPFHQKTSRSFSQRPAGCSLSEGQAGLSVRD